MAKVFTKVRPFAERQAQILRQVEKGNSAAMKVLAEAAVEASPVDTATYITSHVVYEGDNLSSIPAFYSSEGREGGQDKGAYAGTTIAKLSAMIDQLDHSQSSFLFGNEAEHRGDVEYVYGYAVFEQAKAAFPAAVEAARAAVRSGQGGI